MRVGQKVEITKKGHLPQQYVVFDIIRNNILIENNESREVGVIIKNDEKLFLFGDDKENPAYSILVLPYMPDNTISKAIQEIPTLDVDIGESCFYPIKVPLIFTFQNNRFEITSFLGQGAQAIAYDGFYNDIPVVFRTPASKNVPPVLESWFPQTYFIFKDRNGTKISVSEKLYPPIYSSKFYRGALQFLSVMEENNLQHNDLSYNNVLMDRDGNFKVIDYSPWSVGTPGYSSEDRLSLYIALFEIKNRDKLKDLVNEMNTEINGLEKLLPDSPDNYYINWIKNTDTTTNRLLKQIGKSNYIPKLNHLFLINKVILKLRNAVEYLKNTSVSLESLKQINNENAKKFDKKITENLDSNEILFLDYLMTIFVDEINLKLLDYIKMRVKCQ